MSDKKISDHLTPFFKDLAEFPSISDVLDSKSVRLCLDSSKWWFSETAPFYQIVPSPSRVQYACRRPDAAIGSRLIADELQSSETRCDLFVQITSEARCPVFVNRDSPRSFDHLRISAVDLSDVGSFSYDSDVIQIGREVTDPLSSKDAFRNVSTRKRSIFSMYARSRRNNLLSKTWEIKHIIPSWTSRKNTVSSFPSRFDIGKSQRNVHHRWYFASLGEKAVCRTWRSKNRENRLRPMTVEETLRRHETSACPAIVHRDRSIQLLDVSEIHPNCNQRELSSVHDINDIRILIVFWIS